MVNKRIAWAAGISLVLHAILAGLLIFSPGWSGMLSREGTAVFFEISLTEGPDARTESRPGPGVAPAANRKQPAKPAGTAGQSFAANAADHTRQNEPVVLASLGSLSDMRPKGKTEEPAEAGLNGTAAERDAPLPPSGPVVLPRYRETVRPDYPWIARIRGYEGMVLLAAEILPNGTVGKVGVKKSSGYALLDKTALNTLRKWTFEPGKRSGSPEIMWVDVPVKFVLKE